MYGYKFSCMLCNVLMFLAPAVPPPPPEVRVQKPVVLKGNKSLKSVPPPPPVRAQNKVVLKKKSESAHANSLKKGICCTDLVGHRDLLWKFYKYHD